MRNSSYLLILCVSLAAPSCSKESEAKAPSARPTKGPGAPPTIMPWDLPEPKGGPVTAMPELTRDLFRNIAVRVESVERDDLGLGVDFSLGGQDALAVKLVVTSYLDRLKLLVAPDRFTLQDADGNPMPMRLNHLKEPPLPRTYLKKEQSVTGWLTFLVPENQGSFTLKSNMVRDPPISIAIEAPANK